MKLLESKRFKLPQVYFITDKTEIKDIPVGVPFIFGHEGIEKNLIRILEYEVLYQEAVRSGYPFNFKKILKERGFLDIYDYVYQETFYIDFATSGNIEDEDYVQSFQDIRDGIKTLQDYIKDSSCYVDVTKFKELKVFPVWLDKIEEAVHTNIHNFAAFNPNMYNKKLDGMYGGLELASPNRNLIVIDISASIPKAVGATCLSLCKNLAESFYCDVLITGIESVLFEYERLDELDVETAYDLYGNGNECIMFRELVTTETKHYKTAIVFGDNHSPCDTWGNCRVSLSRKDAQKLCKWEVDKLISFHTHGDDYIAGYADFFFPKETEKIKDWVKYLDK